MWVWRGGGGGVWILLHLRGVLVWIRGSVGDGRLLLFGSFGSLLRFEVVLCRDFGFELPSAAIFVGLNDWGSVATCVPVLAGASDVFCDSVVVLEGSCGWPHGGVGSATVCSTASCCVAPESLTWPSRLRFLPAMTLDRISKA